MFIIKEFIRFGIDGEEPQFRCAVRNRVADGEEVRGAELAKWCWCPPEMGRVRRTDSGLDSALKTKTPSPLLNRLASKFGFGSGSVPISAMLHVHPKYTST